MGVSSVRRIVFARDFLPLAFPPGREQGVAFAVRVDGRGLAQAVWGSIQPQEFQFLFLEVEVR